MKTWLHSDYWVEIPAGEYLIGLSDAQRNHIAARIRVQVNYEQFANRVQQIIEVAIEKYRRYTIMWGKGYQLRPLELSDEESAITGRQPYKKIFDIEYSLRFVPDSLPIELDRFYIARFPITENQVDYLRRGKSVTSMPGALITSQTHPEIWDIQRMPGYRVAAISEMEYVARIYESIEARLPTNLEWENAARGADGLLYPWGNEWDEKAGFFYTGQDVIDGLKVNTFSRGASLYGVWGMAGGLPELIVYPKSEIFHRSETYISKKGCQAKESDKDSAWFDHIVALPGKGTSVSLRPVMDKWPRQQWQGANVDSWGKDNQQRV